MMGKICIGVDPDSEAFGVARYFNGKLESLDSMRLVNLVEYARAFSNDGFDVVLAIEDVISNKFIYGRNQHSSKAAQSQIAMRVGRCQQSQVELQRQLDHFGIAYMLFKPSGDNWADNKPFFERVTGWKGKSNKDTRSAAYFGMLAVQSKSIIKTQ